MKKVIAIAVLVIVVLGAIALLAVDIPAPTQTVERTISDDQISR